MHYNAQVHWSTRREIYWIRRELTASRAASVTRKLGAHVVRGAQNGKLNVLALAVSLGALNLPVAIWLLRAG